MERISDEKLFYLRSRWLWRENALNMIIEAKIQNLFSCLRMYNKDFYEDILENILDKI
jgi:Fe-S cluster assembly scaffold protein SufB